MHWFENIDADYYCNFLSVYTLKKELILKKCIQNPIMIEFNGEQFQTVGFIDEYLTNLYGDYMELPPDEKRVPGHEEIFAKYI